MKKITHSFVSMGLSVLGFSFFLDPPSLLIIACVSFTLGGINDWLDFAIFHMFEHRNWFTHSLLSPLLLADIVLLLIAAIFSWYWVMLLCIMFNIAWISHVVLDSLTFTGVYLFLPKHSVNGVIHYKNPEWNLIFSILGVFLVLLGGSINYFWV